MKNLLLFLLFLCPFSALPQDGSIDPAFDIGSGADANVYIVRQLSDGKIIVGGQFMDYNSSGRRNLVRLNANGTLDESFSSPPDLANYTLLTDALEDNGKLVVVGEFGMFNGVMSPRIVRLNNDGSVDPTFNAGTGINWSPGFLDVSKQGNKYIVAGNFSGYNGVQCGNIIRINADGTLDETFPSFVSNTGFNITIAAHQVLPDGKILIGGNFTSHNGVPLNGIGRLDANGSVDTTFNPGTGTNGTVISIAVQPDGKYIIAGTFSTYNGIDSPLLARINPDGTLDDTFSKDPAYRLSGTSLLIQPDGKIIASGFLTGSGTSEKYIVRLQADGSIDQSFDSNLGNVVNTMSFQDDGKILVGGWFEHAGTQPLNRVARLQNEGFLSTERFETQASIYPNPTSGLAHIDFGNDECHTVAVFDLTGKPLQSFSGKSVAAAIDFSDYQNGIYFLRIESSQGTTIKKILKN